MSNLKLPPYQRTQRKSYAGFPTAPVVSATSPTSNFSTSFNLVVTAPSASMNQAGGISSDKIPPGYVCMESQVAGHTFQVGSDEVGMLKCIDDGSVLKPGGRPMCAAREIKFYEQLALSTDPNVQQLKEFVTDYRGAIDLTVGNKTINFLKMTDLTHGMLEPCVIDIKMGGRTWDPLANEQKREAEDSKYVQCKKNLGFCIPGFQTYQISSGNYKKFGKEYGKKLNENTVKDALRMFLNADTGLSRQLVASILTTLWAIQKWMRTQKVFQFFSSSILIVYDARKLRQVLELQKRGKSNSLDVKNGADDSLTDLPKTPPKSIYKKIQRSHSSTNNYEQEMRRMKNNYQEMLDNLVGTYDGKKEWIHVKMIDFAHTFSNSEISDGQAIGLDLNYLNGIEHLVAIFEELLKMCE